YWKIHVCLGGFILRLNKPKILSSFLIVGLHHLTALQTEGLQICNLSCDTVFTLDLYLRFTTADGPRLVYWDGIVGHSGKNRCCLYCEIMGR
ncbi:uncharacterized protein BJ212DRAFT_1287796, partial [Suillus subaureus]